HAERGNQGRGVRGVGTRGRRACAPRSPLNGRGNAAYNANMLMHPAGGPPTPRVTFWGAAQSVTGSLHLVEAAGRLLLLDCGLARGPRRPAPEGHHAFPFRPADVAAVVLSHAHVDHCGNLPNLFRQGFAGPVYCTPATRDLLGLVLADSARIHEEDA